ncbi:MAG: M23 family metallopeptidase [Clostridia bacterium]|nr:M23 family metallopeptidase [Clostridia bacterium]
MKNKERTKPTKKKILTTYLVVAACLLVAAAVTVGVVFGLRNNSLPKDVIENPPVDNNPPDEGNKDPDDDKPILDTSTSYVFIMPVNNANLTCGQVFAYDKTMDWYREHNGLDFSANAGTQVYAAVDGKVTEVSVNDVLYGAVVTIEHANGVTTVYKFIDPVQSLKAGTTVSRGDVIGTIATATGVENKEGDHLHFEIYKNGTLADPDDYLEINPK